MAKNTFRNLAIGDVITVRFNGSRAIGNEPYEMERLTVVDSFPDNITLASDEIGEFDLYFFERRWRYGSSAEVATLLDVA